jgi:hypothetical protein
MHCASCFLYRLHLMLRVTLLRMRLRRWLQAFLVGLDKRGDTARLRRR